MIEEKVECKRLGNDYKNLFEKVVYFIHHTPFAKDFISDNDLKMLSDLDLYLHTGKYEIIEFETNKIRFDSTDIIKSQKEEIEEKDKETTRLNNIIDELENTIKENIKYLKHLDEIGAMCSTQEQRFNKELLEIIERR